MKELKKKVLMDWKIAFPQLTLYAQNKLYKRVGPILIGIELIKLPKVEQYRPHFVAYALWGNKIGKDVKSCLEGPFVLKQFYNKKGFQFSIPYESHLNVFNEVVEVVKSQMPISLVGDVSLRDFFAMVDEYSKSPPLSASRNSYLQASLQEIKLEMALFISVLEAKRQLDQIREMEWDIEHFKLCHVDINRWLSDLEDKVKNPEITISVAKVNMQEKKIVQLNNSELLE